MRLSELEKLLTDLRARHGDVEVVCQSLTHRWPPEPEIRKSGDTEYVLLNP